MIVTQVTQNTVLGREQLLLILFWSGVLASLKDVPIKHPVREINTNDQLLLLVCSRIIARQVVRRHGISQSDIIFFGMPDCNATTPVGCDKMTLRAHL